MSDERSLLSGAADFDDLGVETSLDGYGPPVFQADVLRSDHRNEESGERDQQQ